MRRHAGFTLIELLVVIGIIAILIGLIVPALTQARCAARMSVCTSNYKQWSIATANYSADNADQIFSFTWSSADNPAGVFGPSSFVASAQAWDIIERLSGRSDMGPLPVPWTPSPSYSHLVIQDYLALRIPEPMVVCPSDRNRLDWQIDPQNNFDKGVWPNQPDDGLNPRRWPYSASYIAVPASYDRGQSQRIGQLGSEVRFTRMTQNGVHWEYLERIGQGGQVELGKLKLSDVTFPGGKVHMYDEIDRHSTCKDTFYGYADARQPLLFFDSSVRMMRTGDANLGWDPHDETKPFFTYAYNPRAWEPPTKNGNASEQVQARYRWTRGGLKGLDFGGEVPIDTPRRGRRR